MYELVGRRNDLKQMLIAEKNRFQSPRADLIKSSCVKMIEVLEEQIASITKEIDDLIAKDKLLLIAKDKLLQAKKETLQTISGIGTVVSNELIALLPELGTLDFFRNSTSAGDLYVDAVLESSRTLEYAAVLRSASPSNPSA
ncbi:hypothetical protein [Candidatus Tisiphia endosymbiont of Myopa tessellatipennis]|uniref:hypothetical protein n=1 Tax=Candidatus Tisiphia endosymbiont of Myopa tessellatipennis TaxID=3066257 RepID=UPI0039776B2B